MTKGCDRYKTLKRRSLKIHDKIYTLGVVHPASMHNLMLRYWLASAGIDPDKDVNIVIIPPAQMVSNLLSGNIDGYCVGEPWNSRAVSEGHGYVIATDLEIWSGHPEKMLTVYGKIGIANIPKLTLALVKARIRSLYLLRRPSQPGRNCQTAELSLITLALTWSISVLVWSVLSITARVKPRTDITAIPPVLC